MTIPEYIKRLYDLKRLAVSRFGVLSTIESQIVEGAFDWLVDNLEIKRGGVIPLIEENLVDAMNDFVGAALNIVRENKGFQSRLTQFVTDLGNIQKNNREFHVTTNKFDINTAGVNAVQKSVVEAAIEQYTGNGLNTGFVEPLKDNIYRNILAGANMQDVKTVLKNHILSGEDKTGKLGQYLEQTAQQAVDTYTGAINQQLVEEFKFTGYIISGSLIETSSKQCIYAVEESDNSGGYLPMKEWEEVLAIAANNPKAKLIPGTNLKNLPLNKLHWGCRHDFTPVIMDEPVKK